jgi:hypothetical protein
MPKMPKMPKGRRRRIGPLATATALWKIWRRIPARQRKRILAQARKHGPRLIRRHGPRLVRVAAKASRRRSRRRR